jgi:phasin family protein
MASTKGSTPRGTAARGGSARTASKPATARPAAAHASAAPRATVTPPAPLPAATERPADPLPPAAAQPPQPETKDIDMNAETVIRTVEQATETVEKVARDAVAQGQANLDQVSAKTGELMEQASKSVGELTEFTKGNMEAMIACAKAATTGAEVMAREMAEHAKIRFEATSNAWKAMATAKTPNELFQYQNDFMKSQMDASIAAMSQMTETMLKVVGDVTQPLSNRVALAAEHVKKTLEQR